MRRVAWALVVGFAFAVPWEYSLDLGEPLGNIARLMGLAALAAGMLAVLQAGRVRTPGSLQWLTLGLFVLICGSYFWSIDPQATVAHIRGYFQDMMAVWLVWEFGDRPEDVRALLRAYVAGALVLGLLTLSSFASAEAAGQVRFVAEGQDPNDVARFLVLGLPLAALLAESEPRWAGRLLGWTYLPVGLAGVVLTASRGGFVAAVAALGGCGVVLLRGRPWRMLTAGMALPVCVTAAWMAVPRETLERLMTIPEQVQSGGLNLRWSIWAAGWHAFARAPFFGTGAGSFVNAAGLAPVDTAHNTVLAMAVEGGIAALLAAVGIGLLAAVQVRALRGAMRMALGTALAVWAVTAMVGTAQENRATWLLLGIIALAARVAAEEPAGWARCFAGGMEESGPGVWGEPAGRAAWAQSQRTVRD